LPGREMSQMWGKIDTRGFLSSRFVEEKEGENK
jgi:hypothetical protein